MTSKALEKLLGLLRKPHILDTFKIFYQMEKEYWKILKNKLLKVASSQMESLTAKDVLQIES
jgi:hypothetical protein